jgi:3'(2'), 5'-bisphosphate nucleotidase
MRKLLVEAIIASINGGLEILEVYAKDFSVELKADESPLTKADKNAHLAIEKVLLGTKLPILSEEGREIAFSERKNWERFWMVDPLDGTKEFVKRNGEFTVNVALIENGVSILGVIYVPVSKELYFAAKGIGSFKANNVTEFTSLEELISDKNSLPIKNDSDEVLIVASRSHLSKKTEDFINEQKLVYPNVNTLSKGSSLKLCMVAEGRAMYYPRYAPTMEWDTAAGQAICELAGFEVVQYGTDVPVVYNKENLLNPWFLVR